MKIVTGCPYVAVMKDHSECGFNLWAMSLKDNCWSTSKCSLSLQGRLWRMAQRFRNDRLLFYFALDKWQGLQLCPHKAWQDQMERIGGGLWDVLSSRQHDFVPFMYWSIVFSMTVQLRGCRMIAWIHENNSDFVIRSSESRQTVLQTSLLMLPSCPWRKCPKI